MIFTLGDISVYFFNWKKTNNNVLKLYKSAQKIISDVCIINSDENYVFPQSMNIIQLDDTYYYGGQYQTAIRNIKPNKIFCVIVGDTTCIDFETLFNNALQSFNNYNIGIYSPNDLRSVHRARLEQIKNTSLYEVKNTDCGIWFIHPNIVSKLKNINYFDISNLGWGIDVVTIFECKKQGLKVVRDYSIETNQMDKTTNYNMDLANKQMFKLFEEYKNKVI